MHEHKLVQGVLDEVLRVASAEKSTEIRRVRVRLNESSHVTPEQFREHFRLISTGTPAESAGLEINLEPDLDGELRVDSIDVAD